MVLEGLGKSLKDVLKKIANSSNVDEKLVKEITRDIQRALLQADVNVKMVLEITKEVERRALTEKPPAGKSSKEHVIRIIYEELVKILGEARPLPVGKQTIMLCGLYGQGKTTTDGTVCRHFHKQNPTVLSHGLSAILQYRYRPLIIPIMNDVFQDIRITTVWYCLKKVAGDFFCAPLVYQRVNCTRSACDD